jgi:hypothetical protein
MMSVDPFPRRTAVEQWIRSGRTGPIPWPLADEIRLEGPSIPDPVEWADTDVRLEAALMTCASGARAELPAAVTAPPTPPARRPRLWKRRKP